MTAIESIKQDLKSYIQQVLLPPEVNHGGWQLSYCSRLMLRLDTMIDQLVNQFHEASVDQMQIDAQNQNDNSMIDHLKGEALNLVRKALQQQVMEDLTFQSCVDSYALHERAQITPQMLHQIATDLGIECFIDQDSVPGGQMVTLAGSTLVVDVTFTGDQQQQSFSVDLIFPQDTFNDQDGGYIADTFKSNLEDGQRSMLMLNLQVFFEWDRIYSECNMFDHLKSILTQIKQLTSSDDLKLVNGFMVPVLQIQTGSEEINIRIQLIRSGQKIDPCLVLSQPTVICQAAYSQLCQIIKLEEQQLSGMSYAERLNFPNTNTFLSGQLVMPSVVIHNIPLNDCSVLSDVIRIVKTQIFLGRLLEECTKLGDAIASMSLDENFLLELQLASDSVRLSVDLHSMQVYVNGAPIEDMAPQSLSIKDAIAIVKQKVQLKSSC
ncbi:hypothetical protein MP228_010973 [Amoeboaphelidium protococcarum]|nr:hypothetical protein MP228_010973 [Amoeboaphelidium protococcarum]